MKLFSLFGIVNFSSFQEGLSDAPKTKCESCQHLAMGIAEQLTLTEKHNFGGGNTKWEEKSLGKWATSETRLLEVTENACGGGYGGINLQSMDIEKAKKNAGCHHLVEHFEEEIEEWFFDNPAETGIDFRTHFCVELGKYCCPQNDQFGPKCQRCPKNNAGEICSNNGYCDGAGDKKGSGKCKCEYGYKGVICGVCKESHYLEKDSKVCSKCSDSCLGCTGPLSWDCKSCASGYEPKAVENSDKFECKKVRRNEL